MTRNARILGRCDAVMGWSADAQPVHCDRPATHRRYHVYLLCEEHFAQPEGRVLARPRGESAVMRTQQ